MSSATAPVPSLLPALRQATAPVPMALALARPCYQTGAVPVPMTSTVPAAQAAPAASPVRTISLEDIIRCVMRRWKAAAITGAIAGAGVFLLLTSKVPEYQAEASVLMRMRDDKVFTFDPVVDNSNEATGAPFLLNNHRIQLKSRQFLEYFWKHLPEADRTAFLAAPEKLPLIPKLMAMLPQKAAPAVPGGSPEQAAMNRFAAACSTAGVDFIKETLMVKVTLRHHSPAVAAHMANAWVNAYMKYVGEEENATTVQASEFLKKDVEQQRANVEEQERLYAEFCRKHGLVGDEEQKASDSEKLKLLHTEQARTEVELDNVRLAIRQIQDAGQNLEKLLSVDLLNREASLGTLRQQLTEKRKSWEQVDAVYGPKHPVYINAAGEYRALSTEISQAVSRGISGIVNREKLLTKEVESLKSRVAAATSQAGSLSAANGEKRELKSNLDAARQIYQTTLNRYNEAAQSSRFSGVTNLRQAETASPPEKPVSPNKPLGLVLGGLSSFAVFLGVPLLLGGISLLRREGIQGVLARLRQPQQEAPAQAPMMHLPQMATMPLMLPPEMYMMATQPVPAQLVAPQVAPEPETSLQFLTLGDMPQAPAQTRGRPDQMLAAAFAGENPCRPVFEHAAAVITDSQDGLAPVILVTSQEREQGKSFIACGLGVAGLAAGRSAVVVDCDIFRPSLSRWLPRLFPGMTLRDMAASGTIPGDMDALRCGNSQLFTIQAGQPDSLLDGAFSQPWFGQLIAWLRTQVGVVILDGPSITDLNELRALASHASRAVLVTTPGENLARTTNTAQFLAGMAPHLQAIGTMSNAHA